jgi:hypothetical protein
MIFFVTVTLYNTCSFFFLTQNFDSLFIFFKLSVSCHSLFQNSNKQNTTQHFLNTLLSLSRVFKLRRNLTFLIVIHFVFQREFLLYVLSGRFGKLSHSSISSILLFLQLVVLMLTWILLILSWKWVDSGSWEVI